MLTAYAFPGNVRELENVLESAYHLCADDRIRANDVSPRLIGLLSPAHDRGLSRADRILADLASGRADFWTAVRDSFLGPDLTREEVREIVSTGLAACGGSYQRLLASFALPTKDYKKFLSFLDNHHCKVDFRHFTKAAAAV